MFKHETVVEEIRPEARAQSFSVIDVANPGLSFERQAVDGVGACTWNSNCAGCSGCSASCSGCSVGGSCVGCSSTFSSPHRNEASNESGALSAKDLALAVKA